MNYLQLVETGVVIGIENTNIWSSLDIWCIVEEDPWLWTAEPAHPCCMQGPSSNGHRYCVKLLNDYLTYYRSTLKFISIYDLKLSK